MISQDNWAAIDHGLRRSFSWTPSHGAKGSIPPFPRPEDLNDMPGHMNSFIDNRNASSFLGSFSAIFQSRLKFSETEAHISQFSDAVAIQCNGEYEGDDAFEPIEELESRTIGNLLPDDEEELLGVGGPHDYDYIIPANNIEDGDDFDLFSSGGGMELESDVHDAFNIFMNSRNVDGVSGRASQPGNLSVPASLAGEHPYGEHPSRTLFVRNINSNVEDSELKALFEQYGAIRTLYTACKHRGFVMISYYDIRAARSAMRSLQNKPLRRRKLDIHFSIPKDNPSDKDVNQGTLVVFNLDASVTNDDLRQIFGVYGEVKEIRETPHKRHHKFIEFYDVRAAEAALRALNRSDIAGKRIKLEPSRPGGARRSLMQQLSQELEQEEMRSSHQQSPPGHSSQLEVNKLADNASIRGLPHQLCHGVASYASKPLNGTTVALPQNTSSLQQPMPIVDHGGHNINMSKEYAFAHLSLHMQHHPQSHYPHSLPDNSNAIANLAVQYGHSPSSFQAFRSHDRIEMAHRKRGTCIGEISTSEKTPGSLHRSHPESVPISTPQLWAGVGHYQPNQSSPVVFPNHTFGGHIQSHAHAFHATHGCLVYPSSDLHVGSAPSAERAMLERRSNNYFVDPSDASALWPGSLGTLRLDEANENFGNGCHGLVNLGMPLSSSGNVDHAVSQSVGIMTTQQRNRSFSTMISSADERGRNRKGDTATLADNKKQYQLDLDRILHGEDLRTTLMVKNIPNKYTSKMLLAAIDEHHRGTYDFIYLPIDFKNKCNVGYAFINMTEPSHIIPFYQAFNGKKWEKFNSEKVASLAYARIQGKAALIAHFQNSSLMNEDKRCRPILFHSEGPNAGDQEPFPVGPNVRTRTNRDRSTLGAVNVESPSSSSSSTGSIKDENVHEGADFDSGAGG